MAWHAKLPALALCLNNDAVVVFDVANASWGVPLVHELQSDCNCIEWSPVRFDLLAVGCRNGICLWKGLPPIRFSSSKHALAVAGSKPQMSLLCRADHTNVCGLSWSASGKYPFSVS
jgi:aladin